MAWETGEAWLTEADYLEKLDSEGIKVCFLKILPRVLILIVKVVPYPKMLSTFTSPPIFSIILLQILSPKPVPWEFILECSSSLPNSMNSFDRFSFLIPTPESIISIFSLTNFSYSSSSISLRASDLSDASSSYTSCIDFLTYFCTFFLNSLFSTASLISDLCSIS